MSVYAFDGTWNEAKDGDDPGYTNTNVFRFYSAYKRHSKRPDLDFYVAGVGTRFNAKTAESQLRGGMVWGVGLAMTEESLLDLGTGHFANASLAEYHVPVNADIGELDVTFIDAPDTNFNPLGIRGIGEIGITGVAAALCNAIWHATGVRVRDLPITIDKLMPGVRA